MLSKFKMPNLGHNDSPQGADITVLKLLVKEKFEPCWFKYLKHKQPVRALINVQGQLYLNCDRRTTYHFLIRDGTEDDKENVCLPEKEGNESNELHF